MCVIMGGVDRDRSAGADVLRALRILFTDLPPEAVVTEPAAVTAASRVWNAQVTHQPAADVRCTSTSEVQTADRAARTAGLPLSVRGGGHDWAGSAVRDGALVVDLSRMRQVDVVGDEAHVAGGATSAAPANPPSATTTTLSPRT